MTTTFPIIKANNMMIKGLWADIWTPILYPKGMKAISTAARNSTRPIKVYKIPKRIWNILTFGSLSAMNWMMKKNRTSSRRDWPTSTALAPKIPRVSPEKNDSNEYSGTE